MSYQLACVPNCYECGFFAAQKMGFVGERATMHDSNTRRPVVVFQAFPI